MPAIGGVHTAAVMVAVIDRSQARSRGSQSIVFTQSQSKVAVAVKNSVHIIAVMDQVRGHVSRFARNFITILYFKIIYNQNLFLNLI